MTKTRFEIDHAGVRDVLRSREIRDDLAVRARRIARAAGSGHSSQASVGHSRALAMVWTDTLAARRSEVEDSTLTRAIDAGA